MVVALEDTILPHNRPVGYLGNILPLVPIYADQHIPTRLKSAYGWNKRFANPW